MSIGRGRAWEIYGAPTDQVGSVNDPRTSEEYGVKWNEKWLYRDEQLAVTQVVLWLRYDLVGAFRLQPDGSVEPLPLPES